MALDVKPRFLIQMWDQESSLHWTMQRTPLTEGRANQRSRSWLRCVAGLVGSRLSLGAATILGLASSPAGPKLGILPSQIGSQKSPENSALPSVEWKLNPPICSGIKSALVNITIHGIPEVRTL